jgi:putative ABC transport system permease protein
MSRLRRGLLRVFTALLPRRAERELARELAAHQSVIEDDLVRRGLSREEAHLAARRRLGPIHHIDEHHREARSVAVLDDLRRDVPFGIRMIRRSPGISLVAIVSLALGIGAITIAVSLIDSLLGQVVPVPAPEQLVQVREQWPGSRPRYEAPTWEFTGLRDGATNVMAIAAIAVFDRSNIAVSLPSGTKIESGRTRVGIVSGNYFPMLQIQTAIGRVLTTDDDRVVGQHPIAVISHAYWTRQFGRSADVLSQNLVINGTPFSIVGVTPSGFTGDWLGRPVDIWVPMMMQGTVMVEAPQALTARNDYWLRLVGRLRPGLTRAAAEAAIQPVYQQVMRDAAGPNPQPKMLDELSRRRLELEDGTTGYSPEREGWSPLLKTVAAISGLLLLVVCANVAGLLLSRAASRQREFAVRLAIGASRARLGRQLVVESMLIAAFGGAGGLLLASWGTSVLATLLASAPVQMFWASSSWLSFPVTLSWRAVSLTVAIGLLAGIVFGSIPVLRTGRLRLASALSARGETARIRFGTGQALVIIQVALTLAIITSTILLVRTLVGLHSQDLGFDRSNLLLVWTQPSATGRQGQALRDLWRDVQARVAAVPGVAAASAWNTPLLNGVVPLTGRAVEHMRVEGEPARRSPQPGGRAFVMPAFFKTLGVPILAGREFTEADAGGAPVVIINATMAKFYFGSDNPVGRRVGFGSQPGTPVEIVGVVGDFERSSPRAAGVERMLTYFPYQSDGGGQLVIMCVAVRTNGDPHALITPLRQTLRAVDPSLPILEINTVGEQLDTVLAQDRLLTALVGSFAGLAGLLACLGLYGLVAHMTARRTAEIGIRMALGAGRGKVLTMILREGLQLVLISLVVGIPTALMATRLIRSRLFGVSPHDPTTMVLASLTIVVVAVGATFVPARRASVIEPTLALREG